ncbi:hypothetical protein LQW54_011055 [Pestalotiopsis sp. IQ-011]
MDAPVDHNDHQAFGYPGLASPNSADKFVHPGTGSHSHDSTCHDAAAFGGDFLNGFSFDTVEPSTLQVSHTSHDDSCVDQCPGSYNSQGLPRGTFPPAPHARPRFTNANCSLPYMTEAPLFPPTTHDFEQAQIYFPVESEFRYPTFHGNRFSQHPPNNGHQQFSTNFDAQGICNMPQCSIPNDCASADCGSGSCSEECCTDPSCEDAVCHDADCAHLGDTCNSTQCPTSPPSAGPFDYVWPDLNTDWNFHQHAGHGLLPHDPNCNHTNTEHDVAITLRHLKDPAAPDHQRVYLDGFDSHAFCHGDVDVTPTVETPALTADTANASPISHRPSLSLPTTMDTSGQHVCRWLVKAKGDVHAHTCGQIFACTEELHNHLAKDHVGQMSSKTKYLCLWEGCSRKDDQVFASRNKLRRHISTHTSFKPYKCEVCQESFSAQQALDQHVRIHTGEKPYKCDYPGCDKAFKQKSALTMHKRTHTGEKPLTCEFCGKSFCESSNLSKHRKIHTANYKFKCTVCTKSFIRIDQLRRHQLKHERDKGKGKGPVLEPSIPEDDAEADTLQIVNEQFLTPV